MGSPPVFWGVRVAAICSFLALIRNIHYYKSNAVLLYLCVLFVFVFCLVCSMLPGSLCCVFCLSLFSELSCVFCFDCIRSLSGAQCCLCLWMIYFVPFRFSLTFINDRSSNNVPSDIFISPPFCTYFLSKHTTSLDVETTLRRFSLLKWRFVPAWYIYWRRTVIYLSSGGFTYTLGMLKSRVSHFRGPPDKVYHTFDTVIGFSYWCCHKYCTL